MEMIPNRSLLNSKFDGYKLHLVEQDSAVRSHLIQYTATQSTASPHALLSFQDVQSRITHNHLAVSNRDPNSGFALYVDADYNIVVIELDPVSLAPHYRAVYELPKPVFSASSAGKNDYSLYPSAVFLDPATVFVSDGHGCMYVLNIPKGQFARLLGQYRLRQSSQPFRIHNAVTVSPNQAVVLLSSKYFTEASFESANEAPKSRSKRPPPEYDVWAVQFTLPFDISVDGAQDLDVLWQRRGEDIPMYTAYDDSRKTFLLVGSSIYREIGAPPVPSYNPSPDEIAPIPRKDEDLTTEPPEPAKPPPYSWTQTSDSVTVAFPLPSTTPKTAIKVTFTPRTLTLHAEGQSAEAATPLPRYSLKYFWDGIQPSTSFWTWDREAEHAYGLLTLHLDKQHEGTRWMQVFAATTTISSADEAEAENVEVPETLDPSELGLIREALEKYTSSLRDGSDTSGLGLGKGVPSLVEGEMDDEIDTSVGREVYITPVGQLLVTGESSPSSTTAVVCVKASDVPFVLLSTPLPGSMPQRLSLVVKTSLDGALFHLDPHETADLHPDDGTVMTTAPRWSHTATYSALAFVLASKQDTRFTHHVEAKAVLAFESGSAGRSKNVYIYRGARTNEDWAKQSVLRIGDVTGGSLLGVGAVKVAQGKQVILCLTERQLVVIHNII